MWQSPIRGEKFDEHSSSLNIQREISCNKVAQVADISTWLNMMTDYVETVTYFCCILSVIAVISNIACLVYTKKTFNENAPYRILQIECIITTSCQLGFFGVLLGSLQESPNLVMCISASSVAMFDHCMLYITRTALSRVRYVIYTFSILVSLQPYNIFVLWNAS